MADTKRIEISNEVYEDLIDEKGSDTWDQFLSKLMEAAYDKTGRLDTNTLEDFVTDESELASILVPDDGEIDLRFESSKGELGQAVTIENLPPGATMTIRLERGEVLEE